MEEKKYCYTCGTEYEGGFCPVCYSTGYTTRPNNMTSKPRTLKEVAADMFPNDEGPRILKDIEFNDEAKNFDLGQSLPLNYAQKDAEATQELYQHMHKWEKNWLNRFKRFIGSILCYFGFHHWWLTVSLWDHEEERMTTKIYHCFRCPARKEVSIDGKGERR